ncbi:alpha/beta hydrolase [Streptosporangium lutulentum]
MHVPPHSRRGNRRRAHLRDRPPPRGDRVIRVYGDLRTAEHVAVIVPGADTTAATFDGGRVEAVHHAGGRCTGGAGRGPDPGSGGQAGGGRLARL